MSLERLVVWREAVALAANVLTLTERLTGRSRQYAADQMIRAAESIPANFAEGIGRGVSRDCVRFIRIARSSGQELESHLRQAVVSRRLPHQEADPVIQHTYRVRFLLRRFQESVERRLKEGDDAP